jgi:hypothetical protein
MDCTVKINRIYVNILLKKERKNQRKERGMKTDKKANNKIKQQTDKVGKKRSNNSTRMQVFLVIRLHGIGNLYILLSLLQVEY